MNFDYIKCGDCLQLMKELPDNSIPFVLTDIPYAVVNRSDNGLRNLDKGKADIITFELSHFLENVHRVSNNSICIFCGREQFSEIYKFFANRKGTTRPIVWQKSNPSPMNGQHVYLSGVEFAVWFKKRGGNTFNAFCKNTVFKYPNGENKYHPTQKNVSLFEELILDNTNKGDIVLDPCIGGGTTAIAAIKTGRHYIGYELDKNFYEIAKDRIAKETSEIQEKFL